MSRFFDVDQFAPRWANVAQSMLHTDPHHGMEGKNTEPDIES